MLKQKTVYFREEDLYKWEAIDNKAEWLHEHLNGVVVQDPTQGLDMSSVDTSTVEVTYGKLDDQTDAIKQLKKTSPNWCKEHDMEKQYCSNMKHTGVK